MGRRAGNGQTMTKQHRKAIKRSTRRQLYTWGGHYSARGQVAPHHVYGTKLGDSLKIRENHATPISPKESRIAVEGAAALGLLSRIKLALMRFRGKR